jgi:multiple antibiotic resistance protein
MTLVTLTLILFLIMDPIGHVKSFVLRLNGIDPKRQRQIILRELVIALGVILFFDMLGEYIIDLLQISKATVYLASGIILFLGAIKILFPRPEDEEIGTPDGEPYLVPLAIPMIAGPALLATVMLYAESEANPYITIVAEVVAWLVAAPILLHARQLLSLLGTSGLTACEKLMGMVLVLLSVQRFMDGIHMFIKTP